MIDLKKYPEQLKRTVKRCRERNIIIPTFEEQVNPEKIDGKIKSKLKNKGLWDITPENLFRITWKNEPKESGGLYGDVNFLELPSELTGVKARVIGLVGKWFPTGAHKVGAAYGCLVPRLVTGQFDPTVHKAVWPSTGNYCRGGAYNSALLACESIAILPEEMSKERFEWLKNVAGEVIATPGCESNVKEIYDKCWELRKTRDDVMIFNQFDEFGNHLWHYEVTGKAFEEVVNKIAGPKDRVAGLVSATGSGGTIASGDYLKKLYPNVKIVASEALQCPTLMYNGYGGHRIEGIGDKHVPWIHNTRNTDMVIAVDDNDCMNLIPLFNKPEGRDFLQKTGIDKETCDQLDLLGISSIGNVLAAIKFAKYYELDENDIVFTIFTDSMELYQSRLKEYDDKYGRFQTSDAERTFAQHLMGQKIDNVMELSYYDKKRIHNLKYFTWIEQQGSSLDELNAQWYDYEDYWGKIQAMAPAIDNVTREFNDMVGLL